jgi:hypothetical protein
MVCFVLKVVNCAPFLSSVAKGITYREKSAADTINYLNRNNDN